LADQPLKGWDGAGETCKENKGPLRPKKGLKRKAFRSLGGVNCQSRGRETWESGKGKSSKNKKQARKQKTWGTQEKVHQPTRREKTYSLYRGFVADKEGGRSRGGCRGLDEYTSGGKRLTQGDCRGTQAECAGGGRCLRPWHRRGKKANRFEIHRHGYNGSGGKTKKKNPVGG